QIRWAHCPTPLFSDDVQNLSDEMLQFSPTIPPFQLFLRSHMWEGQIQRFSESFQYVEVRVIARGGDLRRYRIQFAPDFEFQFGGAEPLFHVKIIFMLFRQAEIQMALAAKTHSL